MGQGGVVNAVPVTVAGVNSVDADDSDDEIEYGMKGSQMIRRAMRGLP